MVLLPLEALKNWQPFRLDALGLVTLLGAEEVARAIGTLAPNTLTDYMPLLGAYRVAGNHFTTPEPGHNMYNLSDGITNTELSAWFTRWMSHYVTESYSFLEIELAEDQRSFAELGGLHVGLAFLLGTVIHLGLIALAALQADWYGIANGAALLMATLVRNYLIHANVKKFDAKFKGELQQSHGGTQRFVRDGFNQRKKILIVRPDGGLVGMHIKLGLLLKLFGRLDPTAAKFFSLEWQGMYTVARGVGWLAFGVHIVCIGQATLPSQLFVVTVMSVATILTIFNVGTQQSWQQFRNILRSNHRQNSDYARYDMGTFMTIKVVGPPVDALVPTNRSRMYALLAPTEGEVSWMESWNLLPLRPNDMWYEHWYKLANTVKEQMTDHKGNRSMHFLEIDYAKMCTGDPTSGTKVENALTSTDSGDTGSQSDVVSGARRDDPMAGEAPWPPKAPPLTQRMLK